MIKDLVSIEVDDLKKSDKRGLSTLYLYWLENGKPDLFDLPLFIDDNGKGVLSVECFKRVFFAFCKKTNIAFNCDIINGDDGDNGSYNIVRIDSLADDGATLETPLFIDAFTEPKKTDTKRESSKKTEEKAKAKKAEEEKKDKDFDKETVCLISKLAVDFGLLLTKEKARLFETKIEEILKRVK